MGDAPDAGALIDAARERTGLDDFGDDGWQEGLAVLVSSLGEEARLSELGRTIVETELVDYLSSRLQLVAWRAAHPEIAGRPIEPPVVIVGQGRTGTTILFDLLARDPANRVPLTWEVDAPVPPPQTATYDTDPRIAESDARLEAVDLVLPEFRAMHPMGARLAQECVRITATHFRSLIFATQYRVPSYNDWLLHDADMAPAYAWHRRFIEHLDSGHQAERWVLKSPGHLWWLGDLLAEYPDALLVQTHRDPLTIIASLSSLVATLRRLGSDETSIEEAAAEWTDILVEGFDRCVAARQDGTVPADRVVDVQFREFMADPWATIGEVYERLDLELTPEALDNMKSFLAANSQEAHGKHRYSWEDTGLDAGEVRERVRAYEELFDVPREVQG